MIVVIDMGISNLNSVLNALDRLEIKYTVSRSSHDIASASKLILPGVGTFGAGMKALAESDLIGSLRTAVLRDQIPILGICLGMQLFFKNSEESPGYEGLALLSGQVVQLKSSAEFRIPRIGWCETNCVKDFGPFVQGVSTDFYYIHSFHVSPQDRSIIAMVSGSEYPIVSAVISGNIMGTQFHPEKSHVDGLKILKSFAWM